MRLEPNLSILFTELPLLERPAAAAALGFEAAELWWPFDVPEPGADELDGLVAAFEAAGLGLACLNFFAGDMAAGARGVMAVPGADAGFHANLDVALELADRLGCRTLNALYGRTLPGGVDGLSDELAIRNLELAVRAAERHAARVVVEAINPVDVPGFGLPSVADAAAFLERGREMTGAEAWLSLDAYHAAMAGEELVGLVDRYGPRIGHVQVADVPGRHEPGSGGLDLAAFLRRLEAVGYDGWIGLEYVPTADSPASLRQAVAQLTSPAGGDAFDPRGG